MREPTFVRIRGIRGKKNRGKKICGISVKKKTPHEARPLNHISIVKLLYNIDLNNAFVNLYEVGSVCEAASVDSLVRSSIFDACYNLTE